MKKFLTSIALVMVAACASATIYKEQSFINNGTYLCVTNNTSLVYTNQNNAIYYSYQVGTNVQAGATNPIGNYYPKPLTGVKLDTDANGDVNPTYAVHVVIGATSGFPIPVSPQTGQFLNTIWNPTNLVANFTNNANSTNVVTFTLYPLDSFGYVDTSRSWSFVVNQTANVPVVVTTNLPTAFCQGLRGVVPGIGVNNIAGAGAQGTTVDAFTLQGFTP